MLPGPSFCVLFGNIISENRDSHENKIDRNNGGGCSDLIWFFIIEEIPIISKYMAGEDLLDLIAYAR